MNSYDVDLRVRVHDVWASGEDVAASNARVYVADALAVIVAHRTEVEPDEVLQTPADVLRGAASKVHVERLVAEGEADSAYDAGRAAGLEQAVALLHGLADDEELDPPAPGTGALAAYTPPPDPFAEAHDKALSAEEPLLGLATTGQLLDELRARIEVHGPGLDYRTVDTEAHDKAQR